MVHFDSTMIIGRRQGDDHLLVIVKAMACPRPALGAIHRHRLAYICLKGLVPAPLANSPFLVEPQRISYAALFISLAHDYLYLGGRPAGGRDEHLASGVGIAHSVGYRCTIERHALDLAAGR